MEQVAAVVLIAILVVLGLAMFTLVGGLVAAFTASRLAWPGRLGLGVAGSFFASLVLAIVGISVRGPGRIVLAVAAGVVLVLLVRALRRLLAASARIERRNAA